MAAPHGKSERNTLSIRWRILARRSIGVLCAGLVVEMLAQPFRALRALRDIDFVAFFSAARLLRDGACLYCPATQRAMEQNVLGETLPHGRVNAFVNPPAAALLLRPIAGLEPRHAYAIFATLSLAATIAGGIWLWRWSVAQSNPPSDRTLLVIASVFSAPAAWGIALGQWDPLIFAAVVAGIVQIQRHPALGGLLLSVGGIKPQLIVVVPFALLIGGHWRALLGLSAGAAAFLISTVLLVGPAHVMDWPHLIASSVQVEIAVGVPGILGNGTASFLASAALTAAGLVLLWHSRRTLRADSSVAVTAGLLLSLLTGQHILSDDFILVAIPLVMLGARHSTAALTAALFLSATYLVDLTLPYSLAHIETFVVVWISLAWWRAYGHGALAPAADGPVRPLHRPATG